MAFKSCYSSKFEKLTQKDIKIMCEETCWKKRVGRKLINTKTKTITRKIGADCSSDMKLF